MRRTHTWDATAGNTGRNDTEPTQQSWLRRRHLPTFQINQTHVQPKETMPKNSRLIAIKNFTFD